MVKAKILKGALWCRWPTKALLQQPGEPVRVLTDSLSDLPYGVVPGTLAGDLVVENTLQNLHISLRPNEAALLWDYTDMLTLKWEI